ncbi:MAG TPA: transposase [Kiritimatiellia bacterium]|nr:transposase [Kiritimatiellia bacterium]HMP00769.1 transposase [Kiritimatiellia bacterium]
MNTIGKSHERYDKEFKNHAVEMLLESGRPLKQVARDLGVSDASLRAWKTAYLGDADAHPEGRRYTSEHLAEENRQLRREVEYLRRQRDILKKACGILSTEPPRGMP